jgi:hypothetical protein
MSYNKAKCSKTSDAIKDNKKKFMGKCLFGFCSKKIITVLGVVIHMPECQEFTKWVTRVLHLFGFI